MIQLNSTQKEFLAARGAMQRFELLAITLPNGQTLRAVIRAAQDYFDGTNTYYAVANGVWERGPITSEAMRGEFKANSLDLTVTAASTVMYPGTSVPLSESFLPGVWDAAAVTITVVYMPIGQWGLGNAVLSFTRWAGMVSDSRAVSRSKGSLTAQDWTYLANTQVPKRVIQPGCFNTFGDAACTFVLSTIALANTVAAGFSPVSIPPGAAWPATDARGNSITASYSGAGYFANGKLQWTSGNNAGYWSHIAAQSGSSLILSYAPPFPIQLGDGFTAYAGCQKTLTDCTSRWGNQANFAGFPFVPVPEQFV